MRISDWSSDVCSSYLFLRAYVQDHIHHLMSDECSILWGIAILDGFSFDLAGHLTERSDCKALLTGLMRDLPFFLPACHRRNGLLPGLRAAILQSGGDGRRLPAPHGKAARWFVHRNSPAKATDPPITAPAPHPLLYTITPTPP